MTDSAPAPEVDQLYRAFFLFREARVATQGEPELLAASRAVELEARARGLDCWERIFGAQHLETADHRGFLARWCLKGLSVLQRQGVLSEQDWLAATRTLAAEWEALGRPGGDYDFGQHGPEGAAGAGLRGLYLLHRLFLMLDEMALSGAIPAQAREAALDNLRLRAPLYWKQLLPQEAGASQALEYHCVNDARQAIEQLAHTGKLEASDALRLLELMGFEAAEAPIGGAAPEPLPGGEPPPGPGDETSSAESVGSPMDSGPHEQAELTPVKWDSKGTGPFGGGPGAAPPADPSVPPLEIVSRPAVILPSPALSEAPSLASPPSSALSELRGLELLEARVRESSALLSPRLTLSLAAAFRQAREQRWSALLGADDARAAVSPVLQQELGGLLAARLQGRNLERAVGVLSSAAGSAGRSPAQAEPAATGAAGDYSTPSPEISFLSPAPGEAAAMASSPARGGSTVPAGPDPGSFNPAWVSDLVDFAQRQEQQAGAARAVRPRPASARPHAEPEPARVPLSLRLPVGRLIPGLMEELSIHWLLFLGAFLVLAGGLVLTVSRWSYTSEIGRYLPLLATTLFFQGLAWGVQEWLGLHRSARALAMITVLFLPLNSLAMALLGLFGSPGGVTLGLSSLALLAAVGVSATRRSLTAAEPGAQAPSTLDLSARLVSTCGLAAVWPFPGAIPPILAAAAGLGLAAIGLAPGLSRASKRESGLDGGSLWFATMALGAAYLALIIRMTESAPLFGLLLFGLVHLLSVASAGLAGRAGPADTEVAVSAFLGAFSRFAALVATLGVLSGGVVDNG